MPINVLCPTCHKELAAPDELAGKVAECPYCQNRFQVNVLNIANAQTVRMPVPVQGNSGKAATTSAAHSINAAGSKVVMSPPAASSNPSGSKQKRSVTAEKEASSQRDNYPPGMPTPAAMPPVAPLPPHANLPPAAPFPPSGLSTEAHTMPPVVAMPPISRSGTGSVSMPLPPVSSGSGPKPVSVGGAGSVTKASTKRRMNRAIFKTADTAKSQVHLGADGRLPELHLEEGALTERTSAEEKKQTNPMLLLAVLGFSVGMSVLMLLFDGSSASSESRSKAKAREIISERYLHGNPLEPYQILLREAQQANAQGKVDVERARYRRVLDMLHSEGTNKSEGLTGLAEPAANASNAPNDRELERQLSILLAD